MRKIDLWSRQSQVVIKYMNVIEGGVKNIEQMENNYLACRQSQKGGFDSCDDIVTIN